MLWLHGHLPMNCCCAPVITRFRRRRKRLL
jgi:hypothetical protein